MRKFALVTCTTLLVLALAAGVAGARTGLRFSPATTTLTGSMSIEGGTGSAVICESVSITITLHSSVSKTSGTLAGFATINFGSIVCQNGTVGLLVGGVRATSGGPYHVQYRSFWGTLPSINSVQLAIAGVELWIRQTSVLECLSNGAQSIPFETTGGNPATGWYIRGVSFGLRGGFMCLFATGHVFGEGSLSTAYRISLI